MVASCARKSPRKMEPSFSSHTECPQLATAMRQTYRASSTKLPRDRRAPPPSGTDAHTTNDCLRSHASVARTSASSYSSSSSLDVDDPPTRAQSSRSRAKQPLALFLCAVPLRAIRLPLVPELLLAFGHHDPDFRLRAWRAAAAPLRNAHPSDREHVDPPSGWKLSQYLLLLLLAPAEDPDNLCGNCSTAAYPIPILEHCPLVRPVCDMAEAPRNAPLRHTCCFMGSVGGAGNLTSETLLVKMCCARCTDNMDSMGTTWWQ